MNGVNMFKTFVKHSIILIVFTMIPSLLSAESPENKNTLVEPSFLDGLEYRSIGPYRGGRVTAVEGTASNPFTFYMGSTGGGVWKTENAGITWENISDKFFKAGSIGSIEAADSDPNVIYVGTGSDAPRGNKANYTVQIKKEEFIKALTKEKPGNTAAWAREDRLAR